MNYLIIPVGALTSSDSHKGLWKNNISPFAIYALCCAGIHGNENLRIGLGMSEYLPFEVNVKPESFITDEK